MQIMQPKKNSLTNPKSSPTSPASVVPSQSGVMPGELSLDEPGMFGGEPEEELESGEVSASVSEETGNIHGYLRQMTKLLKQDAVRFLNNQEKKFGGLDELFKKQVKAIPFMPKDAGRKTANMEKQK